VRSTRRALAWGLVAVGLYLLAGTYVWSRVPARLLYEGEAPPAPYRWVRPPAALASTNERPSPGAGEIGLSPTGSASASILTDDAQAGIIFPHDSVAPRPGATSARVTITPVDPQTIAPPPAGLVFDGNGYRVEATYSTGGPLVLRRPVTPVLRYPRHATALLRSAGGGWTALDAKRVPAALQIFAASDQLGVFVAAGPAPAASVPWLAYGTAAVAVGVAGGVAIGLRRRRARRAPAL